MGKSKFIMFIPDVVLDAIEEASSDRKALRSFEISNAFRRGIMEVPLAASINTERTRRLKNTTDHIWSYHFCPQRNGNIIFSLKPIECNI